MPEPFKNLLGPQVVADMGRHLARAWGGFDRARFEALALDGLDALEMKARAQHLCAALEQTLPADFAEAASVMEAALAPADPTSDKTPASSNAGLAGWALWPMTEYVARHGLDAPERALQALHAMTQRFTAEWAVRPYLLRHPQLTFAHLHRWLRDPSPHVRRWVSEGTRPRLPWGMVLKPLVEDPSPTLPLLEALMDDPSEYVRRSVANHLNDIAKDHPHVVEAWVREHLPGASKERQKLLRHACRTLIKTGHAGVLGAFGVADAFEGEARATLSPKRAAVGGELQLGLTLRSNAQHEQKLLVDYAVHHVKANGDTSPKVFKGWALVLAPGESRTLSKRHSLRPITTRRYYPGKHTIEFLVNGAGVAQAEFWLEA